MKLYSPDKKESGLYYIRNFRGENMKKVIIFLSVIIFASAAFASDVQKNEEYFKEQIKNQKYRYSATGLIAAIQDNNSEAVGYFMKAGFNPNKTYFAIPVTFYALKKNSVKSLETLLDNGADPNAKSAGISLLSFAISQKNADSVKLLTEYGADVNKSNIGNTPLETAVRYKQKEIAEILINAGAVPDKRTLRLLDKPKNNDLKELFNNVKR